MNDFPTPQAFNTVLKSIAVSLGIDVSHARGTFGQLDFGVDRDGMEGIRDVLRKAGYHDLADRIQQALDHGSPRKE